MSRPLFGRAAAAAVTFALLAAGCGGGEGLGKGSSNGGVLVGAGRRSCSP